MPIKGMSRVKKAMAMIKEGVNDDVKGVYLAGLQNIVAGTPARKGVARNNWTLNEGSPKGRLTTSASVNGARSLNSIMSQMPNTVLGKKLYFTNPTPYINVLEYGGYPNPVKYGSFFEGRFQKLSSGGYSRQAPGGWVRKDLILMKRKIRSLR